MIVGTVVISWATPSASAQVSPTPWTTGDAFNAFNQYDNAFLFDYASKLSSPPYSDGYAYRVHLGSYDAKSDPAEGFWKWAEEIEMAEDAYDDAVAHSRSSDESNAKTVITELCDGFLDQYGTEWWNPNSSTGFGGDAFNDDLEWAAIAFIRAYEITGNSIYIKGTAGEGGAAAAINEVWNRNQFSINYNGGIFQNDSNGQNSEASYANWPFVIAAEQLRTECSNCLANGTPNWQDMANTVYSFALNNLYVSTTGEVYDNVKLTCNLNGSGVSCDSTSCPSGCVITQSAPNSPTETFSYGVAIGATIWHETWSNNKPVGGYNARVQSMATYLETDLRTPPDSPSSPNICYDGMSGADWHYAAEENGYYILPTYCSYEDTTLYPGGYNSEKSPDYAGMNGITLRWVGYALSENSFDDNGQTLAWAQENVEMAWGASYQGTQTNSQNLTWNDWALPTLPSGNGSSASQAYLYSWDCSDAIAGMMDIPAP